jgi:hypothetical protein
MAILVYLFSIVAYTGMVTIETSIACKLMLKDCEQPPATTVDKNISSLLLVPFLLFITVHGIPITDLHPCQSIILLVDIK